MSKMFKTVTQTWNPFTGCDFACTYCWARTLAMTRLHYPDFKPTLRPNRLQRKFKAGGFVFVSSMGDIACASVNQRAAIYSVIMANPQADFLIQTKSPGFYLPVRDNIVLGVTLETNRAVEFSRAPTPQDRYGEARLYRGRHFVSVEPVMDFDLDLFSAQIIDLNPEVVEIGADNYQNNLPEPSSEKLRLLIDVLKNAGLNVKIKDGLERLL